MRSDPTPRHSIRQRLNAHVSLFAYFLDVCTFLIVTVEYKFAPINFDSYRNLASSFTHYNKAETHAELWQV